MEKLIRQLTELYDTGAITLYEMYSEVRDKGCWEHLPAAHKVEYEKWVKEHPPGGNRTACIVA